MLFPDFPFSSHLPSFPYHYDVRDYLKQYSQHFKLNRFIQFGTQVERVVPLPVPSVNGQYHFSDHGNPERYDLIQQGDQEMSFDDVRWSVTTRELASGQESTEVFDNVLICNG